MTQTEKRKVLLHIKRVERESALSLQKAREQAREMIIKAEHKAERLIIEAKDEAGSDSRKRLKEARAKFEAMTQGQLEESQAMVREYQALGEKNRQKAVDQLLAEFWRHMDAVS